MHMKAVYCLLVLLAGCAWVPKPSPYPYSSQEKMQAAEHWQVFASEVAAEVAASGTRGPVYIQGRTDATKNSSAPTAESNDRTPFDQAFHGFLITELRKRDIPVSPHPEETPLHIDWNVQRVVHQADRSKPPPLSPLGWLTGGIPVLVASPFVDVSPVFGTGALPRCEVIITTQLTNIETRAVPVRNSDVYYINDRDWQHYEQAAPAVQKAYAVVDR
jgi:hypothetical protein